MKEPALALHFFRKTHLITSSLTSPNWHLQLPPWEASKCATTVNDVNATNLPKKKTISWLAHQFQQNKTYNMACLDIISLQTATGTTSIVRQCSRTASEASFGIATLKSWVILRTCACSMSMPPAQTKIKSRDLHSCYKQRLRNSATAMSMLFNKYKAATSHNIFLWLCRVLDL